MREISWKRLPLGAITPKGWLQAQLQRDLNEGFASRLDELTPRAKSDLFTHRIPSSESQFAWWDSETRGNWLWGYTLMAFLTKDATHIARVEQLLSDLKQTQDDDGYIGIYAKEARYQHADGENGELWGQSRALLCLLAYYEFTHDRTYLEAVERAVQLTMQHYGTAQSYFRQALNSPYPIYGLTHGLAYTDVLEWLYELTQNTAYRDFGVWLYHDFSAMTLPFINDDLSLKKLLRQEFFSQHSVHTAEHLRTLGWVHAVNPTDETQRALEFALQQFKRYSLPSGALIGDEAVHGMAMPDSGYEYCTITELTLSLANLLQKNADASLADWLERLVLNAGQGARLANGKGICYLSLDNRLEALANRPDSYSMGQQTHGRFKYSPTHEDVACCCNPNATRLLPHYIQSLWLQSDDNTAVLAMVFGASTLQTHLNGVSVRLTQETDYPFSSQLTFRIQPEESVTFTLYIRKPSWHTAPLLPEHIQTTGRVHIGDDFIAITHHWSADETVIVQFSPAVQVIAYPNGEYAVFHGAMQYVLPIEGHFFPIKSYPLADFYDYEIEPTNLLGAYDVVILDEQQPNFGLHLSDSTRINQPFPWDSPAPTLGKDGKWLVPLGTTTLRRASFPMKRKSRV